MEERLDASLLFLRGRQMIPRMRSSFVGFFSRSALFVAPGPSAADAFLHEGRSFSVYPPYLEVMRDSGKNQHSERHSPAPASLLGIQCVWGFGRQLGQRPEQKRKKKNALPRGFIIGFPSFLKASIASGESKLWGAFAWTGGG